MEGRRSLAFRDLYKLKKFSQLKLVYEIAEKRGAEVYLVGGTIRDLLLRRPLKRDFDFAVKGETKALVGEIAARLPAYSFPLDEPLGIWRLVFKRGKKKEEMDFSVLPEGGIELDLRRRDFTVNSLALQLTSLFTRDYPAIIDPLNGLKDLEQKKLRVNGEDSFRHDPVRLLRAFRLAANLNLEIEDHTLYLIRKNKDLLAQSAAERVRSELFAIFQERRAAFFLKSLFQVGILEELFPEIKSWINLPQGPHHDFSLLEHAHKTVEAAEFILTHLGQIFSAQGKTLQLFFNELVEEGITRKALFKFGAFFHDAGKPITYYWPADTSAPRFLDHDHKGRVINWQICQRLKLSRRATKIVTEMTEQHMRIFSLAQLPLITPRAKYRFFHDLGKEGITVALLSLADKLAARQIEWQWPLSGHCPDDLCKVAEVTLEMIRYYQEDFTHHRKRLLLNGQEIMKAFGLPPGQEVGKLLARLQEAENAGLIQNKDEAWEYLKNELLAHHEPKGERSDF